MKKRIVSAIIMTSLALQLVACGGTTKGAAETDNSNASDVSVGQDKADSENEASEEENTSEQDANEVSTEENSENGESTGLANPWKECTEDEAKAACPRLFKLPEEDLVSSWSMMDVESNENGTPGQLVELDFRMGGMDYTARAQYGVAEDYDISGMYYDWDVTDDITLANWGEGNMKGKYCRHIEDGWTVDLCTWYDIEIGIAYSLSVEGEDLDGFDLQAIAEQMYNPDNEPRTE